METRPQTIQIFLPDGSPRSIKIAEITNRTVNAILIPRNKLPEAEARNEIQSVGLYFLIGTDEDKSKPIVYVGEAENCLDRLKQHHRNKEFWNYAIVIVSKINAFTKSHVKYLEHVAVKRAKEIGRYLTENGTIPTKSFITEPMEADMLDCFDTMKILMSTLGYPIFDEVVTSKSKKKDILTCKGKEAIATGELVDDGFVVFKGSTSNLKETNSTSGTIVNLRKKLIDDGILVKNGSVYVFDSDYLFTSPSSAAATVLARSANGWTAWKNTNGQTLDELKRN
ncbi:MAG: GIY-YIG nuclease family protein [Bacteroidota bacterium]|jgi:hypothetical protein|nr:GIY-YIG nuclease family protein [Bacteroidota bacterium]